MWVALITIAVAASVCLSMVNLATQLKHGQRNVLNPPIVENNVKRS